MTQAQVIVGGGGVGKTTLTSLLAIDAAQKGEKVLAVTFDPSLRLGDLLKEISKKPSFQNLDLFLIDPLDVFQGLIEKTGESSHKLKENKLFKNVLEQIVGLQEFTSLYYLNQAIKSGKYDRIIVDTPPFQDALDFFKAPEKLLNFFEAKILKFFLQSENSGFVGNLLKASRRISLKTLKSLTGSDFFSHLLEFFQVLEKMRPTIIKTLEESKSAFENSEIEVNYISAFNREHIAQAEAFLNELNIIGIKINKYYLGKYPGDVSNILANLNGEETLFAEFLKLKLKNHKAVEEKIGELQKIYEFQAVKIPYLQYNESDFSSLGRILENECAKST